MKKTEQLTCIRCQSGDFPILAVVGMCKDCAKWLGTLHPDAAVHDASVSRGRFSEEDFQGRLAWCRAFVKDQKQKKPAPHRAANRYEAIR